MSVSPNSRMPALFIGHGSPMNTFEQNRYTETWRALGAEFPNPRALLVISAHWYFGATAVTAMPRPRTIHDFYGFPEKLFEFEYPAPGDPELAQEVSEMVKPMWLGLDRDQWGLDHGTWSVLAHMYPAADVPVLQLSINALKPIEYHLELGARLASLRERGVLIVASGNVVHNLGLVSRAQADTGFDWAHRFDDAVHDQMTSDPSRILSVTSHRDYKLAVPTPEHFLPLLYIAALADKAAPADAIVRGYSLGSLSMTAYGVGCTAVRGQDGPAAASLPAGVPAEQTNT
jgi:4,5-DOPA dioxygenase extradiol